MNKKYKEGLKMYSIRFLKLTLVSLLLSPLAYANDDVIDMDIAPYLVTAGDPASPVYANAGDNLRNGVGSIFTLFASGDGFICTASAISATHVLTAAHCLRNGNDAVANLLFVLNAGQAGPSITPAIGFSADRTNKRSFRLNGRVSKCVLIAS